MIALQVVCYLSGIAAVVVFLWAVMPRRDGSRR